MEIKNLLGKLNQGDDNPGNARTLQGTMGYSHPAQGHTMNEMAVPQVPRPVAAPTISDMNRGKESPADPRGILKMANNDAGDGIILDLGEGISLNIPIRKRMSLSDFLRLAEKVKALELLGEEAQQQR